MELLLLVLLERFTGLRVIQNSRIREVVKKETEEVKARFQATEQKILAPMKKKIYDLHDKLDKKK